MNKIIIAMISIIIIFSAIFLAISIYSPNEVENEDNIIANIANQDKVTDECVEEYEQLNNENIEEAIIVLTSLGMSKTQASKLAREVANENDTAEQIVAKALHNMGE